MLQMVAPEASYEQISGRILQNRDFQVGGKFVSQSWLWNPGISAALGGLWGVSRWCLLGKGSLRGLTSSWTQKAMPLNENAKQLPEPKFLPCVFEGQNHRGQ